jgi:hypothetical protein
MGSDGGPEWVPGGRAVRLVRHDPGSPVDITRWPATVPAVEQLLREGLELPSGLTVLVGENGSGKSTVMEMLAEACGLNPQGGSAQAKLFRTRDSEPGLGTHLVVERGATRPRWSYFLRADTMHTLYSYLEDNPGRRQERLHELSHGEGFLEILRTRVNQPGFISWTNPTRRCRSPPALGWSRCCTISRRRAPKPSSPPTHRLSPRSPARASWSWATGASAPPGGRNCISSAPGAAS